MGERLTEIFMLLFCQKNSDGTKNLVLKGKDLWQRIGKRLIASDMYRVIPFLKRHPEVVYLDLCYNDIGDEGVAILVDDYLSEENTLEHLNLMSCSLGPSGVEKLHSVASTLKLKTLRLNGNKLRDGGKFVAWLLGESATIEHLDIGDTDQTLGSIMHLMAVIREDIGTNTSLKVLDVSRIIPLCDMYQYEPGHLSEHLGIVLTVNTHLEELHAQKCEFDGHDTELLLLGLRRNHTLLLLDLGYNRIADHGIELLAKWLKTRPNLLALRVPGNAIGNVGARALSYGLPFSKVRLLDISYNRITDAGMIDILNSIKKPYVLRVFYMWGNNFGFPTNKIIERMIASGVLDQNHIDVRLYTVDGIIHAAFYPMDHYKHRYYCVMDHGCPIELKIKKLKLEHPYAQPRPLVKFKFQDRFPIVDPLLPLKKPPCTSTEETVTTEGTETQTQQGTQTSEQERFFSFCENCFCGEHGVPMEGDPCYVKSQET